MLIVEIPRWPLRGNIILLICLRSDTCIPIVCDPETGAAAWQYVSAQIRELTILIVGDTKMGGYCTAAHICNSKPADRHIQKYSASACGACQCTTSCKCRKQNSRNKDAFVLFDRKILPVFIAIFRRGEVSELFPNFGASTVLASVKMFYSTGWLKILLWTLGLDNKR